MKKIIILVVLSLCMTGCIFLGRTNKVTIGKNYMELSCGSFAILPFIDNRNTPNAKHLGYSAVDAMTDAFETEFIGAGFKVVDRRNIQSALDELKFSYQGDVDPEQRKQIGKLTNSDVMVIGKLRAFHNALYESKIKPDKPSKCTTISFHVKAVHIETGEILWTGSLTQSTGLKEDFLYGCDCDVLKYANKVASDVVSKIVKQIKKMEKKKKG